MKTATGLFVLMLVLALPAFAHESDLGSFKRPIPLDYSETIAGMVMSIKDFQRSPVDDDHAASSSDQDSFEFIIDIHCEDDRQAPCQLFTPDFAVAGELGLIYENQRDMEELEFAPGEDAQITVTALIDKADASLMLLYSNFDEGSYTYPAVFATATESEILTPHSIRIEADLGMLTRVGPSDNLDFAGVFLYGTALMAEGRNADGSWVEVSFGWAPAKHITAEGDIMSLPVTG
ncbi:MAG: hypothetical protein OXE95_09040 [Chloroflexi bacterium]|nr:hypothetical protein [Chloroflexota bacterium]MCY4247701.1 hypothetical protein [Chloroflexota bacterium]